MRPADRSRLVIRTEFAALLRLAAPIILTQLSQMGMGVVDTVMAGHVSAADLAGVALGQNVYWPITFLCTGILMALTPTVAHLHGARAHAGAGEVVRQAAWLGLLFALLVTVLLTQVSSFYGLLGVDAEAIPVAVAYLEGMVWGVLPLFGYAILRYLCEGMSWTLPAMIIAFGGLLLKIPLNHVFMHGWSFGPISIPAMGGPGCGWASAVIIWVELLAMIVIVARSRLRSTGVFAAFSWPNLSGIGRLVRLGVPIGITGFLEFGMFSLVAILVGRFGVEAVAAHQIAMNLGGIAFMIPMAVGIAASIRIGFHVGSRNLPAARRSAGLAVGSVIVFALASATVVLAFREAIAGLYTSEPGVLALAVELMFFVALWQLVDDTQATAIGSLRGFKDTRMPMLIALVAYWLVGMPVGVALGLGWVPVPDLEGVKGFWVGFCVALLVASVVLLARLRWLAHSDARILEFARR